MNLRPIVTPRLDQFTGWSSSSNGGICVVLERPKRIPTVLVGFILIFQQWNHVEARFSRCCNNCMAARFKRCSFEVVGMSLM